MGANADRNEVRFKTRNLEQRHHRVDLRKDLSKQYMLRKGGDAEGPSTFFCAICEIGFNDSISFMDHRNGKKHNRVLGMNMKVRKVGLDAVNKKLELLAQKKRLRKLARGKVGASLKIKKAEKGRPREPRRAPPPRARPAREPRPKADLSEDFLRVVRGEIPETQMVRALVETAPKGPAREAEPEDPRGEEDFVDEAELALLRQMGFPEAFKSSKQQ